MIEVSITEILLFAWAILATAVAFKYHYANWHTVCMMKEILSDESVRNRAVKSWQEFQEISR
jgi:hypothetical protein